MKKCGICGKSVGIMEWDMIGKRCTSCDRKDDAARALVAAAKRSGQASVVTVALRIIAALNFLAAFLVIFKEHLALAAGAVISGILLLAIAEGLERLREIVAELRRITGGG